MLHGKDIITIILYIGTTISYNFGILDLVLRRPPFQIKIEILVGKKSY